MKTTIVTLACLALVAACGSEEPAEPEATTPTATNEQTCTDPLGNGETEIPATDFIVCVLDATNATAGFAMSSTLNGEPLSELKVDLDPFWVDITYPDGLQIIANLGDSWVKKGDTWVEGDASSEDFAIAQATQIAPGYHSSLNPALAAVNTPPDLVYHVEGTETIDGTEYYIITGTTDNQGTVTEMTQWVTADYQQYKTVTVTSAEGMETTTMENVMTAWDEKQNIEAPM